MKIKGAIPVIDLFAGPGGLSEGFASVPTNGANRAFGIKVSVEKDPVAHRTLSLRAIFRSFPPGQVPDAYYDYIRGAISRETFLAHPRIKSHADHAFQEARCAELGTDDPRDLDSAIRAGLGQATDWVLIGGPPCQAYSLAGRSRMRGRDPVAFEKDKRHFLYTEYLRIIKKFGPSVFVMENVKGILTSRHSGSPIFEKILEDLQSPGNGLHYVIRSFVVPSDISDPWDYVIESERFGIPQARHRVILFGVRADLAKSHPLFNSRQQRFSLQPAEAQVSVLEALDGLPRLRSQLSTRNSTLHDSSHEWIKALNGTNARLKGWKGELRTPIEMAVSRACSEALSSVSVGDRYIPTRPARMERMPKHLRDWYLDPRIGGVTLHETRSHMPSDLQRYLFASCFAQVCGRSPRIGDFPEKLLPDHGNVDDESVPFADRFRVQLGNEPSSTVVSHIAKDGHYYIHPDPSQCRSLTVREAARLQTFPDNYFFEGNRTQQYTQVGNAVPPLLARKIANVVHDFLMTVRH